jgi:hypothetical protein
LGEINAEHLEPVDASEQSEFTIEKSVTELVLENDSDDGSGATALTVSVANSSERLSDVGSFTRDNHPDCADKQRWPRDHGLASTYID